MKPQKRNLFINFLLIFLSAFFIVSCATAPQKKNPENQITLLFAGDVMAHKPNYNMTDYSRIWDGIRVISSGSDLAFANIEAPVDENLEYSSYPSFNMHSAYPEACINAGFSVFSLVNNHVNDQELSGMQETLKWSQKMKKQYGEKGRKLYFSGINQTEKAPFGYEIIEEKNWRILFIAVTEILNRPTYRNWINYVPNTEKGHEDFIRLVKELREKNEFDLFVISVHSDETEYVKEVSESRKDYYHKLLDNGVDVVWANHPHVIREREIIGNKETGKLTKVIMYGNGNTISGQRWEPDSEKPENPRDDTGDGLMLEVTFSKEKLKGGKKSGGNTKDAKSVIIKETKPYYITTYINSNWEFLIKPLNEDFIKYLEENRKTWKSYFEKRKELCEKTKETIIWE